MACVVVEATAEGIGEFGQWQRELRDQFPIFANNSELVYLDSAATSQKPQPVLDATREHLTTRHANAGRGVYSWANATTALIERTKDRVKSFLGDPAPEQSTVHFVSGASEGLRRVALDWLGPILDDGDEIICPMADHQANALPWLEAAERLAATGKKITVHPMPYDDAGDYEVPALRAMVSERTRLVAVTHIHHVYGMDMEVAKVRAAVGDHVAICADAAQSIGHLPISLAELGVDFLVFSGHKAMALPGIGVIWASNRRGPMFELQGWAGTPNISGVASLQAALDWLERADLARIERYVSALTRELVRRLADDPHVRFVGCPFGCSTLGSQKTLRNSIVTFQHDRIPAGDLGFVLASEGIMVRSDSHCQAGRSKGDDSVRVSLHVYNTLEEIDRLTAIMKRLA